MCKLVVVRLVGLTVFLGCVAPSVGQGPSDTGLEELDKYQRDTREMIGKMLKGDITPTAADQQQMKAIDQYARHMTYRLANSQYQVVDRTPPDSTKTIDYLYSNFDRDVKELLKTKDKTKEFARLYSDKIIEHGLEVIKTPKPIAQVNAARILARAAALGNPKLAEALISVIKDAKNNDGTRYYALRGLRDLLALPPQSPPLLTRDNEEAVAATLSELILRKVTFSPNALPDEKEGHRVLRREAIRALGQIRTPLVNKERPALVLLKVLSGEDFAPPLRIDERMEAAIGLARMRPDKAKDYQVDYAAEQIARFLNEYTDYIQSRDKQDKKPYRVLAAHLLDALTALKAETNDPHVAFLFDTGKPGARLLETIEKGPGANPSDLNDAVRNKPAPSGQLFKSIADSKVNPPKGKE